MISYCDMLTNCDDGGEVHPHLALLIDKEATDAVDHSQLLEVFQVVDVEVGHPNLVGDLVGVEGHEALFVVAGKKTGLSLSNTH